LHSEPWKILKALVTSKLEDSEQYAADLVLPGKEEAVLQGMTERLIATRRCHGMEINMEKS